MDKQKTQNRIKNLVEGYKIFFPQEYEKVCDAIIMQRQVQADEFATLKGEHVVQRALYEISENLYSSFIKELTSEELEYFKTNEGGRWFAKEFPMFSLTKI